MQGIFTETGCNKLGQLRGRGKGAGVVAPAICKLFWCHRARHNACWNWLQLWGHARPRKNEIDVHCVQKKHPLLFSCITSRRSNQFEEQYHTKQPM